MSLVLDIKKRYPGFTLDMQLEAGEERVALLGASGCGKSCTLALHCRRGDARRGQDCRQRRDLF